MTLFLFLLGLVALLVGAELLVRGAARLAVAAGITPLVVGLTVVAFGTSSPELAVSVNSSLDGAPGIALGNVVGSNIFNILFILGLAAIISPLSVKAQLVRLDVPLMIVVSVAAWGMAYDGRIGRVDGAILFAVLAAYLVVLVRKSRRETREIKKEFEAEFGEAAEGPRDYAVNGALIAAGLVLLAVGSRWLVAGAVAFATRLGISEIVIGLTIIAAGTSLPEVAASAMASYRGERDIAVGNAVGSNIFNILCVLALTAIVAPGGGVPVPAQAFAFDLPVMIAVAVVCFPVFFSYGSITRTEGAVLVALYAVYTTHLVLTTTSHPFAPTFRAIALYALVPAAAAFILGHFALEVRRAMGKAH
ncbi:calcium/sodium antiporter [bacterium]|nr:calcium/sodium antiporter [bacterium]